MPTEDIVTPSLNELTRKYPSRNLTPPVFDYIEISTTHGCMESYTSNLELLIERADFANNFNPLQIFQDDFVSIRDDDFLAKPFQTKPYWSSAILPGIPTPYVRKCYKCIAHTGNVYVLPNSIQILFFFLLALSMIFIAVSAVSAWKTHDSHAFPKITGKYIFYYSPIFLYIEKIIQISHFLK